MSRQDDKSLQNSIPSQYCSLESLYMLNPVLIYLPAHNDMQYSRHRLAWLASTTGGGLGADSDRISKAFLLELDGRVYGGCDETSVSFAKLMAPAVQ